jgi:outer membrane protein OmpA-like peptidoglycan-associated protein
MSTQRRLRRVLLSAATAAALHACASDQTTTPKGPAGPDFAETNSATVKPQPLAASDGDRPIAPDDQVLFDFDSDRVNRDGQIVLADVAAWVKAHPARQVVVEGHTDRAGGGAYNYDLSSRRAQAAADELGRLGVPRDRIVVLAEGEDNANLGPEALNRRVVIFANAVEVSTR